MIKIFILSCLMLISSAYGEVARCPSVGEIRSGIFHRWHPLNVNSNAAATPRHIEKFIQRIDQFYQAEYFEDGLYNAHCYYSGFQEIYLAGNWPIKKFDNKNWRFYAERWACLSFSVEQCLFG